MKVLVNNHLVEREDATVDIE
ncbi:hypothetical protein, partial [Listeria monocytogenes]